VNTAYQSYLKHLPPTPSDILGPFYLAGATIKSDGFLTDKKQCNLVISGFACNQDGERINAVLDIWQADANGVYDERGFKLRGKIVCWIATGYRFETLVPGDYQIADNPPDFRCAHIHVIVTAEGYKPLTTQLYFAGMPYDNTDHWFDAKRCIQFAGADKTNGTFDFVLEKLP
jgi:protocatechuate 3,4-dioxygenase beta subunit